MRGDIIYRVYGRHRGRDKDAYFGAFQSRAEADASVASLNAKEMHGRPWASVYHDLGFEIRETIVDVDFEIPSLPKPRDKYVVKAHPNPSETGKHGRTVYQVFRRTGATGCLELTCEYSRNYDLLQTFEPFRQGDREFALISQYYSRTAVLDLGTGDIVAEEPAERAGFCPVGFYVPD